MYKSTPITQKCKSPLKLTVKVKNTDDKYKTKMKDFALNTKERYDEYEKRGWAQDDTTSGYRPKVANVSLITGAGIATGAVTSDKPPKTSGEATENKSKSETKPKSDRKPVSGDPYSVRQRERAVKVAERNLRRAERRGARNPGKYGTDYTSREEAVKQAKAMQKSPFKIRGCGKNKK